MHLVCAAVFERVKSCDETERPNDEDFHERLDIPQPPQLS